jgi:hypothetical protein
MKASRSASAAFLAALARTRSAPKAAPRRRRGVSESTLVTAILKALQLKGVWAWRVNSGGHVLKAEGGHARAIVKGAPAGTPDILLVIKKPNTDVTLTPEGFAIQDAPLGMLCGLEVKSATGKLRASQVAWQAKAARHGVRYGVARSVSEALELVRVWSGR